MNVRSESATLSIALVGVLLACGCAPSDGVGSGNGTGGAGTGSGGKGDGSGGSTSSGSGGATTTGSGGSSTNSGGAIGSGGATTSGSGGSTKTGSGGTAATGGRGGSTGATGGVGGAGGTKPATGGTGTTPGTGGAGGGSSNTGATPLDCGSMATAIESHGSPANRINYVIVGDGYSQAELTTTLIDNVKFYMAKRFTTEIGAPYGRYRNFVNICVLQVPSTPICGSSQFGCCGNDSSRLASCNDTAVDAAIKKYMPASFVVDWKAVVLNGKSWWNSGGMLMYWSGGNADADGAALHEGSHGFHQLADEYGDCTGGSCGSNTNFSGTAGTVYPEVNSCGDPTTTDGKWIAWKGYNATASTGMVGTWSGSRYVGSGQYRPSANSMMNSLFGDKPDTSFNPVSREQMAVGMWRYIKPIDSTEPAAGAVTNPAMLKVNVIDPAVISVDWTVDGVVKTNGGITLDTSTLSAGSHTISAKAYDNAGDDLVRTKTCPASVTSYYCHAKNWANSVQTVTWTVTKS